MIYADFHFLRRIPGPSAFANPAARTLQPRAGHDADYASHCCAIHYGIFGCFAGWRAWPDDTGAPMEAQQKLMRHA